MGVHTTGSYQTALGVDHIATFGDFNVGANCGDLAVVIDENTTVGNVGPCHGLDVAVFNKKHIYFLL